MHAYRHTQIQTPDLEPVKVCFKERGVIENVVCKQVLPWKEGLQYALTIFIFPT